jgi:hypothetical protein
VADIGLPVHSAMSCRAARDITSFVIRTDETVALRLTGGK